MNFIVAATTDIGLTKSTNQDSYNVRVFSTKQGKIVLAILCDGMGGLSKGEVASASLVNAFPNGQIVNFLRYVSRELQMKLFGPIGLE